jgi:hypothetical protein
MKRETLKSGNGVNKVSSFDVWCEHCSIRVAPNEEQIVVRNKTYHQRCYAKSKPRAGAENERTV